MSFYYQHSIKCELLTSYSPTCIWSSSTIWSCRWGTISSFNLQGISSLLLSVEHLLGEDLTRLGVDLECVLPLVPNAVHDVVVHLIVGKRPVLVDGINPKKKSSKKHESILRLCAKILEIDIWWKITYQRWKRQCFKQIQRQQQCFNIVQLI